MCQTQPNKLHWEGNPHCLLVIIRPIKLTLSVQDGTHNPEDIYPRVLDGGMIIFDVMRCPRVRIPALYCGGSLV